MELKIINITENNFKNPVTEKTYLIDENSCIVIIKLLENLLSTKKKLQPKLTQDNS